MDDEADLDSTDALPPGLARDPRTMGAGEFHLGRRWLTPEERAALARRPRFYRMPWLVRAGEQPAPWPGGC